MSPELDHSVHWVQPGVGSERGGYRLQCFRVCLARKLLSSRNGVREHSELLRCMSFWRAASWQDTWETQKVPVACQRPVYRPFSLLEYRVLCTSKKDSNRPRIPGSRNKNCLKPIQLSLL